MPATPEDIWKIGDVLLFNVPTATVPEEMRARQTAARAYYAAFHLLLEALRARVGRRDYQIGHSSLTNWLRTSKTSVLQVVGQILEDARVLRVDCEYKLDQTIQKNTVTLLRFELQREIIDQKATIIALVAAEPHAPPIHRAGIGEP